MSTSATVRVMSPEEIAAQSGADAPFLFWPQRDTVFAERAMRLKQLSSGHPMADFLGFMSALALAQQAALKAHPSVPFPDASALAAATRRGQPPIVAADWPRDPAWLATLRRLATDLQSQAPSAAQALLQHLVDAPEAELDALAQRLLSQQLLETDLAAAPFVGAALQVYFTHLLLEIQRAHTAAGSPLLSVLGRTDDPTQCPCCGSAPTASVTRTVGGTLGQRYLHCSLCSLGWHLPRVNCPRCQTPQRLSFLSLDVADADAEDSASRAAKATIQAESCEACGHYLKIMHTERDPFVEPVADDLASLTLDLLVSDSGAQRHGQNLLLFFGDPESPPPPDPGGA
jgi:FdhE protein